MYMVERENFCIHTYMYYYIYMYVCMYVFVKAWPGVLYVKCSTSRVTEMPIKHEAKLSALLASMQHAKCFILRIARARPCFNCRKELTHEHLVKA